MFDFDRLLSRLGDATVLCIGDLMLDTYVYGEVTRVSPEAPAMVIKAKREEVVIGGAGNVAHNIASLGARCVCVGVVGADEGGRTLASALAAEARLIESCLVLDPSRPTTRKTRFVSEHFSTHLLRADWELAQPVSAQVEKDIVAFALAALPRAGAVVFSDYVYRGATLITPNRKELAEATRNAAGTQAEIASAAAALAEIVDSKAVLVTLSEGGMTLVVRGFAPVHVPAYPVKVLDVSGAGDTVVATLAAMLAIDADYEEAMRAANAAASVVVGKRGTATVSAAELRDRILAAATLASEHKIVSGKALDRRLAAWRAEGLRIGFTNGCFDLLHPGHVKVLTGARAACDRLVVGLNSDGSVKRLKGEGRPVQDQTARAEVLAALEAVDLVAVFDEDTPLELIKRVRPRVLVKGADYRVDQVVGREAVEADGGEVVLIDILPGYSTTRLLGRT